MGPWRYGRHIQMVQLEWYLSPTYLIASVDRLGSKTAIGRGCWYSSLPRLYKEKMNRMRSCKLRPRSDAGRGKWNKTAVFLVTSIELILIEVDERWSQWVLCSLGLDSRLEPLNEDGTTSQQEDRRRQSDVGDETRESISMGSHTRALCPLKRSSYDGTMFISRDKPLVDTQRRPNPLFEHWLQIF